MRKWSVFLLLSALSPEAAGEGSHCAYTSIPARLGAWRMPTALFSFRRPLCMTCMSRSSRKTAALAEIKIPSVKIILVMNYLANQYCIVKVEKAPKSMYFNQTEAKNPTNWFWPNTCITDNHHSRDQRCCQCHFPSVDIEFLILRLYGLWASRTVALSGRWVSLSISIAHQPVSSVGRY